MHERYGAIFHAYCLMSNHYHLLVETPDANLPQIMRHINGSYTTYFNVKRKRFGHLLQGRYKAFLVSKDDYAMELSRYIHLNPVRAAMVETPEEHPWSSYRAYIGKSKAPDWLKTGFIHGYFADREPLAQREYARFVSDTNRRSDPSPLENASAATILGSEAFVEGIRKKYLEGRRSDRELPAIRALESRPSFEQIMTVVDASVAAPKRARKIKIYLMKRYSGATLKAIGEPFGLGVSAVSQVCRRFEDDMRGDRGLSKLVNELEELILSNV